MLLFGPRVRSSLRLFLYFSLIATPCIAGLAEVSYATTLTLTQIKKIERLGGKAATKDHDIKNLKKKLDQGGLSKRQVERIEKDIRKLESEIQQLEGAARLEGGGSKEGKELFDKNRERENKDWELMDAEDDLADAEKRKDKKGIKRATRRIKRIKKELAILNGDFQTLKTKLLEAAQKAKAASGKSSGKTKSILQSYKLKGTATTKSGSQMATTKLNLPTLVAGVMVNYQHTPESFVQDEPADGQSGRIPVGAWTTGDEEPNPVGTVKGGEVALTVRAQYLYSDKFSLNLQYAPGLEQDDHAATELADKAAALNSQLAYKIGVAYGFDTAFTQIRYSDLYLRGEYDYGASEINDNPSQIYGLREGVSPWNIVDDVEGSGLPIGGWTHAALPFGTTLGWQPAGDAGVLDDFIAQHGEAIAYQEPNAGTAGAPAAWDPRDWPITRTHPIPHLQLYLQQKTSE